MITVLLKLLHPGIINAIISLLLLILLRQQTIANDSITILLKLLYRHTYYSHYTIHSI